MSSLLDDLKDESGFVSPQALSDFLQIAIKDLAAISGLTLEALIKPEQYQTSVSQQRLGEIILILNAISSWCSTPVLAFEWYRLEPLPGFGGRTAEELVKLGLAENLMDHIKRIEVGGFT